MQSGVLTTLFPAEDFSLIAVILGMPLLGAFVNGVWGKRLGKPAVRAMALSAVGVSFLGAVVSFLALSQAASGGHGEGHGHAGVAQEQDRRVRHHPGVLEQRIEPLAVRRHDRAGPERALHHEEREQKDLSRAQEHHGGSRQRPRLAQQRQPEHTDQRRPQQDAPLLASPRGGEGEGG